MDVLFFKLATVVVVSSLYPSLSLVVVFPFVVVVLARKYRVVEKKKCLSISYLSGYIAIVSFLFLPLPLTPSTSYPPPLPLPLMSIYALPLPCFIVCSALLFIPKKPNLVLMPIFLIIGFSSCLSGISFFLYLLWNHASILQQVDISPERPPTQVEVPNKNQRVPKYLSFHVKVERPITIVPNCNRGIYTKVINTRKHSSSMYYYYVSCRVVRARNA